ncbi:glycerophosphoryl diester phosphodiesterase [Salinimicrobium catena]|uniref:Glycerophosphoryl diester phosphodiesterase n=1 Tax=Salinimicrobium catena TaxID=390640 RepID=A0A1H5P7Y6_9FLAO|nr:glycerophosphodiester phosphodiesterase family protein [Salinimicrobium catena]SDL71684.1 glycerophosphoryl diester phosphodiesterase [Salinimicrobium catena]SEF09147.1 glycerophosphoryl diester phosphodiesterase [Salinimicrobium catena]
MKLLHLLALGIFAGSFSCSLSNNTHVKQEVMVIGHRGDAGNFPENSIPGFLSAVEKGAGALEMDVVISADKKVVVSHEPYMASHYMLDPQGNPIPKKKQLEYNFYEMDYETIKRFEAGLKKNKDFPKQKKISSYKPLLEEVIDSVEAFTSKTGKEPVEYWVEVKSGPKNYHKFQPGPAEFARLVMNVIQDKGVEERTVIKSFDPNFLNQLHKDHPQVRISYLVSKGGIDRNLSLLDFKPDYYSPRHKLIKSVKFVDSVKTGNMKLVPWTVNRKRKIRKMLKKGVDGIITDYPERALEILRQETATAKK